MVWLVEKMTHRLKDRAPFLVAMSFLNFLLCWQNITFKWGKGEKSFVSLKKSQVDAMAKHHFLLQCHFVNLYQNQRNIILNWAYRVFIIWPNGKWTQRHSTVFVCNVIFSKCTIVNKKSLSCMEEGANFFLSVGKMASWHNGMAPFYSNIIYGKCRRCHSTKCRQASAVIIHLYNLYASLWSFSPIKIISHGDVIFTS